MFGLYPLYLLLLAGKDARRILACHLIMQKPVLCTYRQVLDKLDYTDRANYQ
jgi:hypothetical protein